MIICDMNQTLWSTKYEWWAHLTSEWESSVWVLCSSPGEVTACYTGIIHWQKCHTRGESQGTYNHIHFHKFLIRLPTLLWNSEEKSLKSKTRVSVATQKSMCPIKILKKVWTCIFAVENTCSSVSLTLVATSSSFSTSLYQQIFDICIVLANQIIHKNLL